ncbi:MAG: RNA-binding transcriptional accessory protein [Spirochaetales bacterium]|nr:RNA-binding transcriptional accessory protein [Spirochaetales bacterium]
MKDILIRAICDDLNLKYQGVKNTTELLENGATIPFIARYRKELTQGLDEIQVRDIFDRYEYYDALEKRRETILTSIESQGLLTAELKKRILQCKDKTQLEDIYLPFRPKKRTRASVAKAKGLEPLALIIYNNEDFQGSKDDLYNSFINPDKEVKTLEEALSGALDIIAEWISDDEFIRGWVRDTTRTNGYIRSFAKSAYREEKTKYMNYYEHSELLHTAPSHRILAIRRGEKEGVLSWKIEVDEDKIIAYIQNRIIKSRDSLFKKELTLACVDTYKRLIAPSIEKEVFNEKIERDEIDAISVFSKNLKNLLLSSPAGRKVIMGVDPGYRTGCKIAIIDKQGDFKEFFPIYPHNTHKGEEEAEKRLLLAIEKYKVELIAIGNGTASKQTDSLIRNIIDKNKLDIISIMVSEAGASVYSASKIAIKEFPELDITARGAISIARRLQDPLAELVKIDPKSIGVGQYQHDVNQKELKRNLDLTVQSCVNYVGVELNTASSALLSYVSGIGPAVAENIVKFRTQKGSFSNRKELLAVNKLGEKAFEQCAGFLRIRDSKNPLDNSAIHPETYHLVDSMARDLSIPLKELIGNQKAIACIDLKKYVTDEFGLLTLKDIIAELKKPGLDPRKEFKSIEFSNRINDIQDLHEGMIVEGAVTNVTNFGAFIDIGVHQDGLVHISKLSQNFVNNPHDIVAVGDVVKVRVLDVDIQLKRISLERIT